MFTPELNVLIACGTGRLREALTQPLDWRALIVSADAQGLLPILSRGLNDIGWSGVPQEAPPDIRARAALKALRSLGMAAELARLMREFETAGITAVAFKGPTLAYRAYGDLALRDSSDLDVFVPRPQIPRALELLAASGYQRKSPGFQIWLQGACEVALRRQHPECEVDLHWQFSPPYFLAFDAGRALERSVMLGAPGLDVRTLRTEDLLLYLCVHAARECWALRSILDVAMLLRRGNLDWDDVLQEASRVHCWRALGVGLLLASQMFEAPMPPAVRDRVQRDRRVGALAEAVNEALGRGISDHAGAPGGAMLHLGMVESTFAKARYLWRRAVQPNHLDADFLHLPERLAAAYYVVRPLRVACVALGRLRS